MRKGVVDIGTNTFNLLIADCTAQSMDILYSTKRGVALGMGGITRGIITDDAMDRGVTALSEFEQILQKFHVSDVKLIATAAVREASNSSVFLAKVKKAINRDVLIIDGQREAEFIFKGVSLCHQFDSPSIIMDIGGGSTEFILADKEGIKEMVSLKIGVSRLYQMFDCSDPFTEQDVLKIESFIESHSQNFFLDKNIEILLGSSGTFETFYELIYRKPFPLVYTTIELDIGPFLKSLEGLIDSTLDERNQNEFIIPIRKKMAPFAAVKTRWVIRQMGIKKILISPYSLKEGALI